MTIIFQKNQLNHKISQIKVKMNTNKIFWDINEVAAKYGVNASKIRFYEKDFDLKIKRDRSGDRQFTKDDIEKID